MKRKLEEFVYLDCLLQVLPLVSEYLSLSTLQPLGTLSRAVGGKLSECYWSQVSARCLEQRFPELRGRSRTAQQTVRALAAASRVVFEFKPIPLDTRDAGILRHPALTPAWRHLIAQQLTRAGLTVKAQYCAEHREFTWFNEGGSSYFSSRYSSTWNSFLTGAGPVLPVSNGDLVELARVVVTQIRVR